MSRACIRLFVQAAVLLCAAASLPWSTLNAQGTLIATARLSSQPVIMTGVDSGKFLVSIKLTGVPEFALLTLNQDQMVLLDEAGRAAKPAGIGIAARRKDPANLLAAYTRSPSELSADRQYLFFVEPGSRTFELRVADWKPVRVTAPFVGFGR